MRALALACLALLACSSDATTTTTPPKKPGTLTEADRRAAIGDVADLSPHLQRAFDPIHHEPMRPPGMNDWLDAHPEPGQTFAQHRDAKFPPPDDKRNILYLLPLGEFTADAPSLATLSRLVRAYYGLEVRVLPAVPLADVEATRRGTNRYGEPAQMKSPEVLKWLVPRVPADGFALLALTMMDLYPSDDWNYVFGQASFRDRVGVQSFARQDPAFYDQARPDDWKQLVLRRAAWTIIHEIGHTFGLHHCIYFECIFAGANHQAEADSRPLHACPVCTRKLHGALNFDPATREDRLVDVFDTLGFTDEAAWSKRRATWIRTGER
jgi:archaemetzincin